MTETDDDDEAVEPFVLRSYPGVLDIEPILEAAELRPTPKWCDEYDKAKNMADAVCKRLFGFGLRDAHLAEDPYGDAAETERVRDMWHDALRDLPPIDGDVRSVVEQWLEWDWDVTDGNGGLLRSLHFFGRPIGVAMCGLAGRRPDEEPPEEEFDQMEARLRQSWGLKS